MNKFISLFVCFFGSVHLSSAQQATYVMFSGTGDTVLYHTSYYSEVPDTLTTFYCVSKGNPVQVKLISGFKVKKYNSKPSIPSNTGEISPDTLEKYNLIYPAEFGTTPKKFRIRSKIIAVNDLPRNPRPSPEIGYLYEQKIVHKIKIGRRTAYTDTVGHLTYDPKEVIVPPKVKEIYGNKEIDKYFLILIVTHEYQDPDSYKKKTVITHKRLLI